MAVLFRLQAAIVLSCVALASSSGVSTQFHAQDGIGQYSYGYSGGPSAKTETKTADGVVRGQYSYVDAHGIIQTAVYVADPVHGFRVAATNDPAVSQHAAVHHAPEVAAPVPAYHGPVAGYHLPPGVDTPEVQIAKSAHFQAVAEAKARNAHASYSAYYPAGAAYVPYAAAHSHPGYYTQVKDTPEVAAAKSAHFAAVHEAKARAHAAIPYQDYHHSNYASGYYGYYVPVPVKDTPEVAAAKAAHFAAVHEAKSRVNHAYSHEGAYYPYASGYAAYAPLPVKDTPEVAAAKAAHFAAVHEAKARTAHAGSYYPYAAAHSYYAPLPVGDTPEVAAAKAAHYAAVHEAKARNHYAAHYDAPTHYSSYVPLPVTDTPEVAHAKAAHLAAVHHAKATHWW